jgi:hypothetical protein
MPSLKSNVKHSPQGSLLSPSDFVNLIETRTPYPERGLIENLVALTDKKARFLNITLLIPSVVDYRSQWSNEEFQKRLADERSALREGLAAIASGRVTKAMRDRWITRERWLAIFPQRSERGSFARYINVQIFPDPPVPTVAHALLLAEETKQEQDVDKRLSRGDVCQCKRCEKLFLAYRPETGIGRPITDYCSKACRARANEGQAPARMAEKRGRAKAIELASKTLRRKDAESFVNQVWKQHLKSIRAGGKAESRFLSAEELARRAVAARGTAKGK